MTDELDRLQYNDKELEVSRFQPWTKIIDPVHSEAEVGGWDPRFWSQNPPPELLEEWASRQARVNLMLAANLPRVVMAEPRVTATPDGFAIEVAMENQGVSPTALRQAQLVRIGRPDTVALVFPAGMMSMPTFGRGGRGGKMAAMGGGRGGRGSAPGEQAGRRAVPRSRWIGWPAARRRPSRSSLAFRSSADDAPPRPPSPRTVRVRDGP